MSDLILFWAQFRRELIYLKRYFFNSVGGLLTFYIVFLLIFFGYRGLAGGTDFYGTGLGNIIVGYLLWMFALMIYQDLSYNLFNEAREGILEQLYMSPYGYTKVSVYRLISSFLQAVVMIIIILIFIMLTTGRYLNLDLFSLIPLVVVFLLPIVGLGFAMGGLQLIFKRIQSFLQIVQFLLIGLVAAPISMGWTQYLPGTMASHLVREVMVGELAIWQLAKNELVLALIMGLFYLFLGWGAFKFCEKKAMRSGRLAQF